MDLSRRFLLACNTLDPVFCAQQIVLVEEAAEVPESHVLACLSKGVEHLIQIGDHMQLRPKVEVYELQVGNLCCVLYDTCNITPSTQSAPLPLSERVSIIVQGH